LYPRSLYYHFLMKMLTQTPEATIIVSDPDQITKKSSCCFRSPDSRGLLSNVLTHEERLFIRGCAEKVVQSLEIYGFDTLGYKLKGTLDHWYACSAKLGGGPIKFIKWKFAAYYAANCHKLDDQKQEVEQNVLTSEKFDDPSVLIGGRAHRFILMLKRKNSELYESWLQTALMIKKGCPRPDDDLVMKSELETFEILTTQAPEIPACFPMEREGYSWHDVDAEWSDFDKDNFVITKERFIGELRRTVNEVVKQEFTELHRISPFFPSTSANYINSRLKGGAVGVLLSHHRDELIALRQKYGGNMVCLQRKTASHSTMSRSSQVTSGILVSDGRLKNCFSDFYKMVVEKAMVEEPISEPLGLKEALKIRVISKGPPHLYTALKPLQRFLWRQVYNHPAGRLVGEPVSSSYVQERLGKNLKEQERYLSVDYKDATNQMHGWVSKELIKILVEHLKLSAGEAEMFNKGLTDHIIQLNQKRFPGVEGKPQQRGQLMGSVVSFPLLCLVNMTLLRMAKEIDLGRYLTVEQSGCMVNGDDGCIRTTNRGKNAWEILSSWVGLKPSIGKVYFSREFLNMNSRTFTRLLIPDSVPINNIPGTARPLYFREVKFFNLGLFLGIERSSGGAVSAGTPLTSLSSRCREMVLTLPDSLRQKGLQMYIRHHKSELMKLKVPWFLPEHLGGLGLPSIPSDPLLRPSSLDLRMARLYHEFPTEFELPGKPPITEWRTWRLAQQCAKERGLSVDPISLARQQLYLDEVTTDILAEDRLSVGQVMSLLVVELLFNKSLKELYKEIQPVRKRIDGKLVVVDPKQEMLDKYYHELRVSNSRVCANKKRPIQTVSAYDPYALPGPKSDLTNIPLYPTSYASQLDTN
jgi:hypothetical protein